MTPRRAHLAGAHLAASAIFFAVSAISLRASAQSEDELRAARALFQEAFRDEREQRLAEALEKFRRVAKVKESASVRYRIATVLASMGRLREARDIYRALAAAKSSLTAADEIADSAAERAVELDRKVPKLTLRLQDAPPPDVRVTVDGAPVPVSTTPRTIELDPGEHVVSASARGSARWEQKITLTEGGREVAHTVRFVPGEAADERAAGPLPWIALGGGGALVVTGAVLLAMRERTIDDIEAACPGNVCPSHLRDTVEGDRDQAKLFGPLGGAFAVTGLAAIAVGAYMLVRSPPAAREAARIVQPRLGGLKLALTF